MAEAIKLKNEDDYFSLEFRHPVHALGKLLWDLMDSLRTLEGSFKKRNAKHLREKIQKRGFPFQLTIQKDTTKVGVWAEEFLKAKRIAELSLQAAEDCGKWTRWGLGSRAGEFETSLRRDLGEAVAEDPKLFDLTSLKKSITRIWNKHDELVDCAVDSEDHAVDDWIAVLTLLKQRLVAWIEAHRSLVQIIIIERRKKVGDWMYKFIAAGSDTEELLKYLGPQLYPTRNFEEFESWMNLPWLSASARCSFMVKLGVFKDSFEEIDLVHEELPRRAGMLLREVDLTLAECPGPTQSKATWALWITKDYARKPVWDDQTCELRFVGSLCKKYSRAAPNQVAILEAFELEGWQSRIHDPLPAPVRPSATRRQERLKYTIVDLNDGLQLIRFHQSVGGVRWSVL